MKQVSKNLFAFWKCIIDVSMAAILILLTSPLMVMIGLWIRLESTGPVIFKQARTGKDGKIFNIYKFRSMVHSNDVLDVSVADKYTRVGRIIRKLSLDELPQLFNILIGQMSFIGPRPWIHHYYENMSDEYRVRYTVRPGLTGLAQVMGRNHLSIFEKINYDIEYIKKYSFKQDLRILLLTIKTVLSGSGVDSSKETIHEELEALRKHLMELD